MIIILQVKYYNKNYYTERNEIKPSTEVAPKVAGEPCATVKNLPGGSDKIVLSGYNLALLLFHIIPFIFLLN